MLQFQTLATYVILGVALLCWWPPGPAFHANALQEPFSPSLFRSISPSIGETSATAQAAKLLFLEKLVSLENDVLEAKTKRSFPGFGSPLDRLSASTVDLKAKQRKVAELQKKRRFGLPLDRIGANRLSNARG